MATMMATQVILNSQLECSVCYHMFTDPRNLPCGHTFCRKCLQSIVTAAGSKSDRIPCPTCRAEFQVSDSQLQDLPTNFIVAQLISALPANSQCVNNSQHGPAQHVCLDCWDALCLTCSNTHTTTKFTKNHTVMLLSEVTTDDIQAHKAKQIQHCEVHPNQEVVCYCDSETCQRFVCDLCTTVKCQSHTCLELSEANDKFITEINNTLTPLQELSNKCDSMIKSISSAIQILSANQDTVQHDINTLLSDAEVKLQSLFDKLLTAIRQCQNKAIHTVNRSHSEQMEKLQTCLADKHKQSQNIEQHVASVEHHLTRSSNVFHRSHFAKSILTELESETGQTNADMGTYLLTDTSKWKTDMRAWMDNISDTLTTATTRLPQLTEYSLVTQSVAIGSQVWSAKHQHKVTAEQERQAIEAQAEVDEARRKMDENLRALGVTTSAPAGVIYIKKNSSKYDEDEDYRERDRRKVIASDEDIFPRRKKPHDNGREAKQLQDQLKSLSAFKDQSKVGRQNVYFSRSRGYDNVRSARIRRGNTKSWVELFEAM